MRYCPNIPCPHRQRVSSPAEFLDHVARCSDCGTKLVVSEEDAIEGVQPSALAPYRVLATVPDEAPAPVERRMSSPAGGAALVVAGILVTLLLYRSGTGGGAYVIALWPMVYGVTRLLRSSPPARRPR